MGKLGLCLLQNAWESTLSPHFGMAEWVAVHDTGTDARTYVRNTGLTGRWVVDVLRRLGCTDVVFAHIGPGGLRSLKAAGIRAWYGPEDVPASELVERLMRGDLRPADAPHPPLPESGIQPRRGRSRGRGARGRSRARRETPRPNHGVKTPG